MHIKHIGSFILRLLAFTFTMWLLMEYIFSCNIDTRIGVIVVAIIFVTTIVIFAAWRQCKDKPLKPLSKAIARQLTA